MSYSVKEIFYSLQGEGFHAGRATVFCRFSGCNLWSGLEKHRATAKCTFCDTDFVGTDGTFGGKYKTANELAELLREVYPETHDNSIPYVVFTGGEPTLQLDEKLVSECKALGFEVGIETNGTKEVPKGVDWICVSPKPNTKLKQTTGNEIKLIYPQQQPEMAPENFKQYKFQYYYIQAMAVEDKNKEQENIERSITFCLQNPQWKLSIQTHKILGVR